MKGRNGWAKESIRQTNSYHCIRHDAIDRVAVGDIDFKTIPSATDGGWMDIKEHQRLAAKSMELQKQLEQERKTRRRLTKQYNYKANNESRSSQ